MRTPLKSIAEAYGANKFGLSFELFPPKTAAGLKKLFEHTDRLIEFEPSFITCTYGAGGSTREKTLEVISTVRQKYDCPVATHLTCVGATTEELKEYLDQAIAKDIQNVVALRGDPPKGEEKFCAVAGGFSYANELVAFIRKEFPTIGIAVAGYPETHQEAPSADADLENLKRKVDAGADVVITQLFYDNRDFFEFRNHCQNAGISVPIVPGLLPVTNGGQIQRIASLCGANLPQKFVEALNKYPDASEEQFEVGVEFATEQTQELVEEGVPGIHFYVLNKSEATRRVLDSVNLRK